MTAAIKSLRDQKVQLTNSASNLNKNLAILEKMKERLQTFNKEEQAAMKKEEAQIAQLKEMRQALRNGASLDIGTIAEPLYVTASNDQDPGWEVPGKVLVGGPEQIAESLGELVAMGVNHLQIHFRVRSAREFIEQTQRFGELVAPLLNR